LPDVSIASLGQLSLLAQCSFFTGEFQTALEAGQRLSHSPGKEEQGLYWSIRANQRLATQNLIHAGEVEPNSVHLHDLLAETYRDMGNYVAAEAEYDAALKLDAGDFTALIGSAATYLQDHSIDSAKMMVEKALAKSPNDPEANYIAGEVYVEERNFNEAESHLKLALNANAQLLPRVHALLGRVYAARGDNQRAIEELRLGLSIDDDGSAHFQLARLYQKLGRHDEADQMFRETKRLQDKKRTAGEFRQTTQ
jgi:Tfp pilus assembly protein PilF